jgi:hypothetical protein
MGKPNPKPPPLPHMSLTVGELAVIELFRAEVQSLVEIRLGLSQAERHDRDDHWIMATRWPVARRWWLEMAVRPTLPQICVGLVTDDPDRSRDTEKLIADSNLTIQEFVGLGFKEAGLDWPEPVVVHCREGADRFCFVTPLELESLEDLASGAMRDKVLGMLDGYHRCFSGRMAG